MTTEQSRVGREQTVGRCPSAQKPRTLCEKGKLGAWKTTGRSGAAGARSGSSLGLWRHTCGRRRLRPQKRRARSLHTCAVPSPAKSLPATRMDALIRVTSLCQPPIFVMLDGRVQHHAQGCLNVLHVHNATTQAKRDGQQQRPHLECTNDQGSSRSCDGGRASREQLSPDPWPCMPLLHGYAG